MKHGLTHAIGLIALATAGLASGPAGAVNANGPYYATPSWDQKLPASTRFVVLTNWNSEAVLDRETGLVWEKQPSEDIPAAWGPALRYCLNQNTGGRTGWRLPAIPELMSVVDRTQSNPALPAGHPFTVQSSVYWSASTSAVVLSNAYVVDFDNGELIGFGKSSQLPRAWCVRSGQGVDPQ
jgi:hypothetical protein